MIDKPSDYPLGSLESRIAARTMFERIQAEREKNVIRITVVHIGQDKPNETIEVYGTEKPVIR
jgi:hypothetical protein